MKARSSDIVIYKLYINIYKGFKNFVIIISLILIQNHNYQNHKNRKIITKC